MVTKSSNCPTSSRSLPFTRPLLSTGRPTLPTSDTRSSKSADKSGKITSLNCPGQGLIWFRWFRPDSDSKGGDCIRVYNALETEIEASSAESVSDPIEDAGVEARDLKALKDFKLSQAQAALNLRTSLVAAETHAMLAFFPYNQAQQDVEEILNVVRSNVPRPFLSSEQALVVLDHPEMILDSKTKAHTVYSGCGVRAFGLGRWVPGTEAAQPRESWVGTGWLARQAVIDLGLQAAVPSASRLFHPAFENFSRQYHSTEKLANEQKGVVRNFLVCSAACYDNGGARCDLENLRNPDVASVDSVVAYSSGQTGTQIPLLIELENGVLYRKCLSYEKGGYEALRGSVNGDLGARTVLLPPGLQARLRSSIFPYITFADKNTKDEVRSSYERYPDSHPNCNKAVFAPNTEDNQKVVIKFTEAFNETAHGLLAAKNLAPPLHPCNRSIFSDFTMVMNYVDGEQLFHKYPYETPGGVLNKVLEALENLGQYHVQLAHFDRCGKAGEREYPVSIGGCCSRWSPTVRAWQRDAPEAVMK
ncbi:hypothetical protein BDM02DRAFT_3127477 [Thelephora ganbajun]|uniref:Uncharacterized protein n=1 Tax=Thelephora ganbajun TaxID=370292 RepID=A0ACB6ZMS9_THEGA|nr:hypothetical protein BDM02DRAFT_3127477 [Thelephora ganbajun]